MASTVAGIGAETPATWFRPGTAEREDQALFAGILGQAKTRPIPTEVREAAEQLVAAALVSPVLKGLRESPWATEPFKANSAERSFRQISDAALAHRLVKSERWPLVEAVARRVLRDGVAATQAAGASVAPVEAIRSHA